MDIEWRTLPHKILLILLAGTIVVFGMMTGHSRETRRGIYFNGDLLNVKEVSETVTQYSGVVRNTLVNISCEKVGDTVTRVRYLTSAMPKELEYTMEYPLAPLNTEHDGSVPGIRILQGEEVLFSGGYGKSPAGGVGWYTEEGIWTAMSVADTLADAGENRMPLRLNRYQVAEIALGPVIHVQGSWIDYGVSVGFTLVTILCVMYPGSLLPWRHPLMMRNGRPTALFFIASFAIDCLLAAVCLWSYYRALVRIVVWV